LSTYEAFFSQAAFQIIDISAAVIERATDIRVRYSLKTPDAIHVATAIEESADLLLTGDRDMARCGEVRVEII
jgi:predicted nucleic acid-binding protein